METGTSSGSPESAPRRPRLPSGMRDTKPGWEEDPAPQAPAAPAEGGTPRRPRLPSGMRDTKPGWEETPEDSAPAPQQPPGPGGGWGGLHPSPVGQPQVGPPPPEVAAKIAKSGRYALLLGGASLILLPIIGILSVVAAIAAIIVGFRARAAAHRAGIQVRGPVAGIVMGIISAAITALALVAIVYLWNDYLTYVKCDRAANTVSDHQACRDAFGQSVSQKLPVSKKAAENALP